MTDNDTVPVITIDGPSGSGKGTISQMLAERLGWHLLDSGAVYRALAWLAGERGIDPDNTDALVALAADMEITFLPGEGGIPRVQINGEEASDHLRTEQTGNLASQIAPNPRVREALLQKQHDFRRPPGLVADGRDMGTTVFPTATLKIFLTASAEVRAKRRHKQLKEKGFDVNLADLLGEIRERDERDSGRKASPLKPAADAIRVDTSDMTIEQVIDQIDGLYQQRRAP